MARPGKRNRKFLGTRNHGKGNAKNRRGKGGKGGWGRAGMHKHRFSYITTHQRDWMAKGGRFGFTNPRDTNQMAGLNLYQIDLMAAKGEIPSKDGKMVFEFDGKILGSGAITHKVHIKARAASEKAILRMKEAGCTFEQLGSEKKE
ncbi:MAG: uL15 family ribosomal protein [Candidatus Micrarchaeota archaeon]|nr:uL15 family ribosomal protein [Candidatus Micrarchaeota archaeon]